MNRNRITRGIIRSHEMVPTGLRIHHHGYLMTIFSSSGYAGSNKGAFLTLRWTPCPTEGLLAPESEPGSPDPPESDIRAGGDAAPAAAPRTLLTSPSKSSINSISFCPNPSTQGDIEPLVLGALGPRLANSPPAPVGGNLVVSWRMLS
eukprot:GAFH01001762.1.p3 GENE.GAFH01001762.1~~GAFH01001762.1.p3  ORF type:complete len:148 (+),score=27.71 GAFH01001762.1:930-1373(+)